MRTVADMPGEPVPAGSTGWVHDSGIARPMDRQSVGQDACR